MATAVKVPQTYAKPEKEPAYINAFRNVLRQFGVVRFRFHNAEQRVVRLERELATTRKEMAYYNELHAEMQKQAKHVSEELKHLSEQFM